MDPNQLNQPQQTNPQVKDQTSLPTSQTQANQQSPSGEASTSVPPGNQVGSNNSGSNIPPQNNKEHGTSKTRNIIAILLLVFVPIIGIFYVFLFTKWPKWSKILLAVIFVIPFALILFAIVLIAINPQRQFSKADDTIRQSASTQILNAVGAYYADNNGEIPSGITSIPQEISSEGADICKDVVNGYLPALPVDPSFDKDDITNCGQVYSTGYFISVDSDERVTVSAPMTEGNVEISVTR